MRLAFGASAIAALTVMTTSLQRLPAVADGPATAVDAVEHTVARAVRTRKRIRYVELKPGQKAPPGAKVIDRAAPTPRVVVNTIRVPVRVVRTVTRTRQSGR
jgi:hypothetical protein